MKKIKALDWILIVISAALLIGCIVEFQRRYLFLYYCIPLVLSLFLFAERRIKGKLRLVKAAVLLLVTMFAIYCAFIFYTTSTPVGEVRNEGSERYLIGKECFEQVSIPSMNGKVGGWLFKQYDEKAPLIIFFNGAGECSAEIERKFYEDGTMENYFPGCNFLCTDYPSYGISEGYVSESSMKKLGLDTYDAAIKWDFVDKSKITVIGYSIGTGPASYLAAHRDLASLVMLAPYDRFFDNKVREEAEYDKTYGIKKSKISLTAEHIFYRIFWGYNVDPIDYARSIEEPVLIISSKDDNTISHEASMRVADKLKNCEVVTLTSVKHENMLCNKSFEAIDKFLHR